jgi:hypothetical protein
VNEQGQATSYEKLAAREFYYDGPRQRWLMRDVVELEPNLWYPDPNEPQLYTDYLGEMPYADGDLWAWYDPNVPGCVAEFNERRGYFGGPSSGLFAQQDAGEPNSTVYLHGDLIDSTMLETAASGTVGVPPAIAAYTAFGELITDNYELTTRYTYAGGYGC